MKNLENSKINKLEEVIDSKSKEIVGFGKVVEEIIDPNNVPKVNFNTYSIAGSKGQKSIFNINGNDKVINGVTISDRIYSLLENPSASISEIYALVNGRMNLMNEMNYLIQNMPEIQLALDTLGEDVVYPNVRTTSGVKLEFIGADGNSNIDEYNNLIKYFRPLDNPLSTLHNKRRFNYNIDEDIKNIVQYFGLYGHMIVSTIPYKNIARDLLYDSQKNKEYHTAKEAVDMIDQRFKEVKRKPYSESLRIDKLTGVINKETNSAIRGLVSDTPYSEADVSYLEYMIENEADSLFVEDTDKKSKYLKGNISDLLKPSSEDNKVTKLHLTNLERIKDKNQKKFLIDKLTGCTHDVIDPTRSIPVKIKDEIVGIYVVEQEAQNSAMSGLLGGMFNSLSFSNTTLNDTSGFTTSRLNEQYSNKVRELLFRDIRDVLAANIDKRLLKNNSSLIEDIEFILRNNLDPNKGEPSIKFIPAEYLTIHKLGPGPLGTPLLLKARVYAYFHIYLMRSDMISKIFLEKPRFNITVKDDGDASNIESIANAVDTVRYALPNINDIGIPDSMTFSSANYHTIITLGDSSGNPPFTINKIDGAESKDNSELLKYLSNIVTLSIGYPVDVLNPSVQLDFAKKIANINQHALTKVISIQNSLALTLSDFCTKRLRCMTGNENIEVKVSFEEPGELANTINNELISQRQTLSDIYAELVDKDPRVKDEWKEQIKQFINIKLLEGVVDRNLIDKAINNIATFKDGNRQIDL